MKATSTVSLLTAIVGTALFTFLLMDSHIDSKAYVILLPTLFLVSLAVFFSNRVTGVDLKSLKITLDEIHKVQKDIYLKTEDFKKNTIKLAEILLFNSAIQGRMNNRDGYELWRSWNRHKVNDLLASFAVAPEALSKISRISKKYSEIDDIFKDRPDGSLKTSDPDYAEAKAKIENLATEAKILMVQDLTASVDENGTAPRAQ